MGGPRPIRVLSDDLANQIAAGEVVERPSSVVKELCENSLDAGASRIDVTIEGGGVALVRVRDDGEGIPQDEVPLAILRHATSKITALADLGAIGSFGFRGEALPSIASVSRFTLSSRARSERSDAGAKVSVLGGAASPVEPCGMAAGTTIEVRDLFFNVPARRKFLRALSTESAHVTEVVDGVALARPDVTVTLERDGRRVREHLRAADREARVAGVLGGVELSRCVGQAGPLGVDAYLSRPERARMGATGLWVFVNDRPVKDRALARAIAHAYGSVLEPGRYPVGVVYLTLPPDLVDVNVHPQKAEVRFADTRAVQDAVHHVVHREIGRAMTQALGIAPGRPAWQHASNAMGATSAPGAPASANARPASVEAAASAGASDVGARAQAALDFTRILGAPEADLPPEFSGSGALPAPYPSRSGSPDLAMREAHDERVPTGVTFLAQLRGLFLLCETEDALLVLDQHAAAERVTFDRLRRAFDRRAVAMQTLLVPELCEATPEAVGLLEELGDRALAMGLDVRPAGPSRVAIHAVPQLLVRANPQDLARALLAELTRSGGRDYSGALDLALATMACHGSLRAGELVSPEEARELCAALPAIEFAGHCPHGRPILSRIPFRELLARVGRR